MLPFKYITRSLYQRKTGSLAAVGGSALVVVVFSAALMIPQGIERISNHSKHDDIAIVLSRGASTETESTLEDDAASGAMGAMEVTRDASGRPVAAPEVVATILMEKLGADGAGGAGYTSEVLVRVRGVTERSFALRPEVKLIEGHAPTPGTEEAIVGKSLRGHFKGLELGQSFELKQGRPLRIVGVFESGGTDESEVFADSNVLRTALGRDGFVSSIRARVLSERFDAYRAALESQKHFGAEVRRESEFVAAQYGPQAQMMQALGFCVSLFFGIGGIIGALITMHSAVANRGREIGTLRALGFSRATILVTIMAESALVTLVGGLVGALIAVGGVGRIEISLVNVLTISEMVFRLEADPALIALSLSLSLALGLIGGLFPAVKAARIRPVDALRK